MKVTFVTEANMKPGVKTTEFWISIIAIIYTTALSTGVIPHSNEVSRIIDSVAALLLALGYTWARVFLKSKV